MIEMYNTFLAIMLKQHQLLMGFSLLAQKHWTMFRCAI